jgi:translation initiation factor IF-2
MVTSKQKLKSDSSIITRPPVVAVLGHVDHGKTTLLDYIRHANTASKESGGITQHIGAYQVKVSKGAQKEETVTFIDTPGHAAFSKLRSRGVSVADIAILVIDASDGVKPQTTESIKYINDAKIPFIVAINKIDLPEASQESIKTQLAEKGVLVEGWGGDVVCVPISAKTGKGVDELLEMILLVNQMKEEKVNLKAKPEGVIIEGKLDSRRGPVATLLVKNGTFRIGDLITTSQTEGKMTSSSIESESSVLSRSDIHQSGKIKAMLDENGKRLLQAIPSQPVLILGFKSVPQVGSRVWTISESNRKDKISTFTPKEKNIPEAEINKNKIKIILKADVSGSLEAIKGSLDKDILLIEAAIGDVTESDILLAKSTQSLILAFRVNVPAGVKKLAAFEKVTIKKYDIIYRLLEDIQTQVLQTLEPTINEQILGEAKIIAQFKMKGNHIAGCRVTKGIIDKKEMVHIKRGEKILATTKIKSLQKKRQDATQAKEGEEVGLVFAKDVDFSLGDVIISYNTQVKD